MVENFVFPKGGAIGIFSNNLFFPSFFYRSKTLQDHYPIIQNV